VGKHDIGSGSSQQHIMESLVVKPLDRIGMKVTEVDKYGTEMHNPEVTVPSGSGNVPLNNYRMIGALAALRKEIDKSEINEFVLKHGMPGFSPTQGHIPAAVPFMGHAIDAIKRGEMSNAMFVLPIKMSAPSTIILSLYSFSCGSLLHIHNTISSSEAYGTLLCPLEKFLMSSICTSAPIMAFGNEYFPPSILVRSRQVPPDLPCTIPAAFSSLNIRSTVVLLNLSFSASDAWDSSNS